MSDLPRDERSEPQPLTPRQEKVARLVAMGRTNKETAEALGITAKTVESHLIEVYQKLHVRSRTELSLKFHGRSSTNRTVSDPFVAAELSGALRYQSGDLRVFQVKDPEVQGNP